MMKQGMHLRVQLAASLGNDLGNETIPNSAASKAFPGVGEAYGYAEIYWFLSYLADAAVSYIEDHFEHLDDFWDHWNEEVEKAGVFVYDASDALLKRVAMLPNDPVTFGNPPATAQRIADETMTALLYPSQAQDALTSQITHILTP